MSELTTTIDQPSTCATMLIEFVVEPQQLEKLLEVVQRNIKIFSAAEGFISSALHISTDKTRVFNYVQWADEKAFTTMFNNQRAKDYAVQAAHIAQSTDARFYNVESIVRAH